MAAPATVAPYGTWPSPITADHVAAAETLMQQLRLGPDGLSWAQVRPHEGGRYALLYRGWDGATSEAVPPASNVRTRVHEYGGGSYWWCGRQIVFANFKDQRLYRAAPGEAPVPITPAPDRPAALRYADGTSTPDGRWTICVRERHEPGGEIHNELVALPVDGSRPPHVIASGRDFYAAPRISPDGRRLAWLCWDHPQMPWDGCELWVAGLEAGGLPEAAQRVAGGPHESIFQPDWSPLGVLHFVSDRSGWWNLYRLRQGSVEALPAIEGDCAYPHWAFALSRYAFLADEQLAVVYSAGGFDQLALVDPRRGSVTPIDLEYTSFYVPHLVGDTHDHVWFIAGSPQRTPEIVQLHIPTRTLDVLHAGDDPGLAPGFFSAPEAIAYPSLDGATAHALFYPACHPAFRGPAGEPPPLIVIGHGGPTSQARPYLDLKIQFWTSRGFAVADLNYGGSTGFGRAYRERLRGQWGVVDVADAAHAVRHLAAQGRVDGRRAAVRGGSAGGYLALCALTFTDAFAAGASYYGVADLEALTRGMHKFEARYLDSLVGPYPEQAARYRARSPIHHTDRLSCPVILFQGLEDAVVPPAQAETMVAALERKGLPYAYLTFEGEQHGFRKAETNRRCLEAELVFYGRVFGFEPAGPLEPLEIRNLPAASA